MRKRRCDGVDFIEGRYPGFLDKIRAESERFGPDDLFGTKAFDRMVEGWRKEEDWTRRMGIGFSVLLGLSFLVAFLAWWFSGCPTCR